MIKMGCHLCSLASHNEQVIVQQQNRSSIHIDSNIINFLSFCTTFRLQYEQIKSWFQSISNATDF